jgi:hypothetical protein
LLVGGAVIAVPTLFIARKENSILFTVQLVSYAALIVVLVRLARASYSAYKYLFSIGSTDASSDQIEARSVSAKTITGICHVEPNWFVMALVAGISIAGMKILSLLLQD